MSESFTKIVNSPTFHVNMDDKFTNFDVSYCGTAFVLSLLNDYEGGDWRHQKFDDFIWNNIQETALSSREKEACIGKASTMLRNAAEKLRLDDKLGEIGEILLYGIMRDYYGSLPVVPKIFYKQNSNDYAKGADSVHIQLGEDGTFGIWLGESKFYGDFKNGVRDAINSVSNIFDETKLRKEIGLITSLTELEHYVTDEKVLKNIQEKLSAPTSLDDIKALLHIPIMILHHCKMTEEETKFTTEYKEKITNEIREYLSSISKNLQQNMKGPLEYGVHFHFIFFPLPSKDKIKKSYEKTAKFHRKDS